MDRLKIFGWSFQPKKFPENFYVTLAVWFQVIKKQCALKLSIPNLLEAVAHFFYRKSALKNYTKFSEKNLWQSSFLVKLLALSQKLFQIRTPPYLLMKIFKTTSQLLENPFWNLPRQYVALFYLSCIYLNIYCL